MFGAHIAATVRLAAVATHEDFPGTVILVIADRQRLHFVFFRVVMQGAFDLRQQAVVEVEAQFAEQRFYDPQADNAEVVTDMDAVLCEVRNGGAHNPLNIAKQQNCGLRLLGVRVRIAKSDFPVFYECRAGSLHASIL